MQLMCVQLSPHFSLVDGVLGYHTADALWTFSAKANRKSRIFANNKRFCRMTTHSLSVGNVASHISLSRQNLANTRRGCE